MRYEAESEPTSETTHEAQQPEHGEMDPQTDTYRFFETPVQPARDANISVEGSDVQLERPLRNLPREIPS